MANGSDHKPDSCHKEDWHVLWFKGIKLRVYRLNHWTKVLPGTGCRTRTQDTGIK